MQKSKRAVVQKSRRAEVQKADKNNNALTACWKHFFFNAFGN